MREQSVKRSNSLKAESSLPKLLVFSAWASFISNVAILGTGGAVRLTGSGLGCPTWPLCSPGSLIPTSELSYHSLIEFGNRLMTGVLAVFAVIVLLYLWKQRKTRTGLFTLALLILGGVILQAVLGGIIVLLHLDANLVGLHYIISLALVSLTAVFLVKMYESAGPRSLVVARPFMMFTHLTTLAVALTVVTGVITTGSGPHSGDATVQRDGVNAEFMAHVHSWPGYALGALTVILLIWAIVKRYRPLPWIIALVVLEIVQILIGVYQARNGLPPLFVGVHMVLAGLLVANMTVIVLRLKSSRPEISQPA